MNNKNHMNESYYKTPIYTTPDMDYDTPMTMPQDMTQNTGMSPVPATPMNMVADTAEPETLANPIYTPAYLRRNIGKVIRVEFLIGDNMTDRVGRLVEVGASYIVLEVAAQFTHIMCDLYSIKFVTILEGIAARQLYIQ